MKKAFTLLEILVVLFILGIIASISSYGLFSLYQNYAINQKNYSLQISTKNSLSLIRNTLNSAIYSSIALDFKPLDSKPKTLNHQNLNFLIPPKEFIHSKDFSLPCFSGFFDAKSIKITDILNLSLSTFSQDFAAKLNASCKLYKNNNLTMLLADENFFAPQDFYNPLYQAKILSLNSLQIQAEIPRFLKNSNTTKISPRIHIFTHEKRLIFSKNHIHLQDDLSKEKIEILSTKDYAFSIAQNKIGIFLKLCQKEKDYSFCEEDFVLNGEF